MGFSFRGHQTLVPHWGGGPGVIAPVTAFSADVTSGNAPLTVTFADESTNTPTSWDWDFGDGSAHSTDQNPTHIYTVPGVYSVTLTATNSAGSDAEIKVGYITVVFVGAYDAIANIVHIYEPARRTLTAYTGNLVRLRRDSDNAESDFGYDANGNLDTAAIATWLGAATGYVVTIYDQKGGDDITQATTTKQPLYVASAQNGHAGMSLNGTVTNGQFLRGAFTNGGALSQPYSIYGVAQLDAIAVNDGKYHTVFDGDDATARSMLRQNGAATPDAWAIYAFSSFNGPASDGNWNVFSTLFNGASSQFWINSVSAATGDAGASNLDGLSIGCDGSDYSTSYWDGTIVSVVIADPNHSDAQRGAMEVAIDSFWNVY